MMRIVVSKPLIGSAVSRLRESGHDVVVLSENHSQEAFVEAIAAGCEGVLSMLSDPIGADVIARTRAAGKSLRVISNYAVGYNNIDIKACTEAGIVVTNTPDVLTDATADIALTLLLMAMRSIPAGMKLLSEGRFTGWRPICLLGHDPRGKTLGILGMGRIGIAMARRGEALGMKIIYHSRSGAKAELPWAHISFAGLLAESDVLSIHCPLNSETKHLIGAAELEKMKRGSVLINTARGPIVDEAALADALRTGHLFSAGLDVYEREPEVYPALMKMENVVLLPHMGSSTYETREAMGGLAASAILDVLAGRRPSHPVNPEVFELASL
ncbi:MAG: D-glycerate dehydrogenase [Candidatus Riflebacteria bacterium]|nr:D-glycerate dehydrogenase [Candidatus Riflebacteria bacterium]